jgi:hypothetical protein
MDHAPLLHRTAFVHMLPPWMDHAVACHRALCVHMLTASCFVCDLVLQALALP